MPNVGKLPAIPEQQRQLAGQWSGTEEAIRKSTNPRHRAILENYRRHALLETCLRIDELMAPDMMVEHPVYVHSSLQGRKVFDGWNAVRHDFYGGLERGESALFRKEHEHVAVADWGFSVEQLIHNYMSGREASRRGHAVDDLDATYVESRWTAMHWHYSSDVRLIGEHVYLSPSHAFQKVDSAQLLTLADIRAVLEPIIAEGPLKI